MQQAPAPALTVEAGASLHSLESGRAIALAAFGEARLGSMARQTRRAPRRKTLCGTTTVYNGRKDLLA
jgi:hypothetical protein